MMLLAAIVRLAAAIIGIGLAGAGITFAIMVLADIVEHL